MTQLQISFTSRCRKLASKPLAALSICALFTSSFTAFAQDKRWWFDIELIVYKRNIAPSEVMERFPEGLQQVDHSQSFALLEDYLYPNLSALYVALPQCFAEPAERTPIQAVTFGLDELFTPLDVQFAADDNSELAESTFDANRPLENNLQGPQSAITSTHLEVWAEPLRNEQFAYVAPTLCRMPNETWRAPFIPQVPRKINGRAQADASATQLLPASSLELSDLATDINRQRGLTTLLHMAWRQEVKFGLANATPLRLIAGTNYAKQYTADGARNQDSPSTQQGPSDPLATELSITPDNGAAIAQSDLINRIYAALDDPTLALPAPTPETASLAASANPFFPSEQLEQLWELDGNLTIFLRYIQRTPYLHVDGELDFRAPVFDQPAHLRQANAAQQVLTEPVEPDRLQSYSFSQLRRVISQQVHYFDHPMFGLIVQIRRYDLPQSFDNQGE